MADYPGGEQDPTGRHPERYFDSNGITTQIVRGNGLECMDAAPPSHVDATSLSAPPSVPVTSYRAPAGADYHWPTQQVLWHLPLRRRQSSCDASGTGG